LPPELPIGTTMTNFTIYDVLYKDYVKSHTTEQVNNLIELTNLVKQSHDSSSSRALIDLMEDSIRYCNIKETIRKKDVDIADRIMHLTQTHSAAIKELTNKYTQCTDCLLAVTASS
jgi:hypothetical protein